MEAHFLGDNFLITKLKEQTSELLKAREFCDAVTKLAKELNLNVFVVTDGASAISNNGNECCNFHRKQQIEWELENGYDPDEDWGDTI